MQNGQTPLAIAQRLGYISVIELLKGVTVASSVSTSAADEKYKVLAPETMQEASMSESEDEGETKKRMDWHNFQVKPIFEEQMNQASLKNFLEI